MFAISQLVRPVSVLAVGSVAGLTLATGALAAPKTTAKADLDATMRPTAAFPNVRGDADYNVTAGVREFDVDIRGVRSQAGKWLTVKVHGVKVGTMKVGPRGHAELDVDKGAPATKAGDKVRVWTAGGKLVSVGTFHVDTTP